MLNFKDVIKLSLSRMGLRDPLGKMFNVIEFETTTYCNRKCNYCPNVDFERFADNNNFLMEEQVFETLIGQLKDLNFNGLISPHLYGEPLSDHRMTDWVPYIKKNLPDTKLKIFNNGYYLNKDNFYNFINLGVDIFYISKHSKSLKKPCRELLESLEPEFKSKHILLQDFYKDFHQNQKMFTNRGGAVALNEEIEKKPPVNCSYATYPVINALGDLVLCCQDFHNNYVFGNILHDHLRNIWFDEKNINLRRKIYNYKFDLKICRDCKM